MEIEPKTKSDPSHSILRFDAGPRKGFWRFVILIVGLIAPQFWLFGPALIGAKVLLPLDCLYIDDGFIPHRPEFRNQETFDKHLSDLVFQAEPGRVKIAQSLRRGEFPLTNPNVFCGAPYPFSGIWSLNTYLSVLFPSPVTIAWKQLAIAVLAGAGMYRLTRSVFCVSFWAACFAAWSYPLTGFFVVWQGYGLEYAVAWFPWMLFGVWKVATTVSVKSWLSLIFVTWQPLVVPDIAGQALIACGLWGVWILANSRDRFRADWWWRGGALVASWALALALAAPFILPGLEYAKGGARFQRRTAGAEERPPVGLKAMPALLIPAGDGLTRQGWLYLGTRNVSESGSAGYAGLIASVVLFPLAWSVRRHRIALAALLGLMILSTSWLLDIPGFVWILRLPILNSMSHNRFVFVFAACVSISAAIGFDRMLKPEPMPRWASILALTTLGLSVCWAGYRTIELPEPGLRQQSRKALAEGHSVLVRHGMAAIDTRPRQTIRAYGTIEGEFTSLQAWKDAERELSGVYVNTLALGLLALVGIGVIIARPKTAPSIAMLLALLQFTELLSFAGSIRHMFDWSLYYPQVAGLRELARDTNSRALGIGCLAPHLEEMYGLRDIRGYDAIDPLLLVNLLDTGRNRSVVSPIFSVTSCYVPHMWMEGSEIRMPPVIQLLSVRYLIFRFDRITPAVPFHSIFNADGFWVYENPRTLPRAFVPKQVRESSDKQTLARFTDKLFDPGKTALVSHPVNLPAEINGSAKITQESPNRIAIAAHMNTPGLVVLSDLWDAGWRATVNGSPVNVERVDYGVRGVIVPAGDSQIEMVYWPASLGRGLIVAGIAIALTALGLLILVRRNRRRNLPEL